jgi:predicted nucleotidyltransferase component of viral defense system
MSTYTLRQSIELFHLLFLSQFGRKLDKKLYAIKGGCNMRFYFNSIRYSEDLDIDVQIISKDTLYKNVNQILNAMPFRSILQTHGIEILNISTLNQTPTTQRWKISLKSLASILPIQTKIEFSRRKFGSSVHFEAINSQVLKQYSLIPIMANHYSIESMYEQKILALALRHETQARDIFDLYLLLGQGIDVNLLDKEAIQQLSIAKTNAMSISFSDFKGQVIAYLPEDYQEQYDSPSVWNSIIEKVIQALDECKHEID